MKTIAKSFLNLLILTTTVLLFWSSTTPLQDDRVTVEMNTDKGPIVIKLYNETPQHRDNFIQLIRENAYDGLLFHRVIENFMIQGGDPDSKDAKPGQPLGEGDRDYTVPAEFHPELFHKKGVLAAARDDHPQRASSAMQFYITQGKVHTDSTLEVSENRINLMLARHHLRNDLDYKELIEDWETAREQQNFRKFQKLSDSIQTLSENYEHFERYSIPEKHREIYKTVGGTPHLDQNYTVFGEVISGLAVVDSIAAVKTDNRDRPREDVHIISVRIVE